MLGIENISPELIKYYTEYRNLLYSSNRADKMLQVKDFIFRNENHWNSILAKSKQSIIESLKSISPHSILHWYDPNYNKAENPLYQSTINRYLWIIFACGQGSKKEKVDFDSICKYFAEFESNLKIVSLLNSVTKNPLEGFEEIAKIDRISRGSTKFKWISDVLLESLAENIDRNSNGIISCQNIRNSLSDKYNPQDNFLDSFNDLNESDFAFLHSLSIEESSQNPKDFEILLYSNKPSNQPLGLINDNFIPINYFDWQLKKETAIFKLIRDKMGGNESGELFERTVKTACQKISPSDINFQNTMFSKSAESTDSPDSDSINKFDEIDLVAYSSNNLLFFSDIKCLVANDKLNSAGANISDQLVKYSKQINTRYNSLLKNNHIYNRETLDSITDICANNETVGALVPLHDYSGYTWHNEVLSGELNGKNVAIIPVQSMLLILSLCKDANDFSEYLQIRHKFSKDKIISFDELEFIIYWLNNRNIGAASLISDNERTRAVISPYDLPLEILLNENPQNHSKEDWRKIIYDQSVNVFTDIFNGKHIR